MIIAKRRVIRVSSEVHHSGRNYVIRINEGGRTISVKLKGTRTWYTITVKQAFTMGAWNLAAQIRAEKKRKKQERREERKRAGLID